MTSTTHHETQIVYDPDVPLVRYRRQAEERYRRLDDVLRAMPDPSPTPTQKGTPS